jgi:hypothetical protein
MKQPPAARLLLFRVVGLLLLLLQATLLWWTVQCGTSWLAYAAHRHRWFGLSLHLLLIAGQAEVLGVFQRGFDMT